ncbi:AraC family transcriptional regulator [Paenibacillus thalictri]|uniref:AraC family transcriptional regulator n=1 Tax=Paenibacillus thalictri TaxID=2527873 RepID=A0A4Q9DR61_9BACL|nr:AraC family transcriptional regulator [Paenibacillus thalictri]TBL76651.1 AraC family transcriptional regulator [Paenibacillus thalictri]
MKVEHVFFDNAGSLNWKVPLSVTQRHILLLVVKGKVHYQINETIVSLGKGEGLFIPEGSWRSAETDPDEPQQMYSSHFRNLPSDYLTHFINEPYKVIKPQGFDYLKQRFSALNQVWIGKMPCYEMISEGILLEILGIVQSELVSGGIPSSKRNLASRVQQYIVQNYRSPLRLKELSEYVDRSPNYISNVFKEVTGRTPVEYMHEIRINTARELLMTTPMTIGEIAESLGYCDQTYFNYMYKKIVGQPPSHLLKGQKTV